MRTVTELSREIDATQDRLTKLLAERAAAIVARRDNIVKAFDDGASRQQICAAFGVEYTLVANVLHRAGRTEVQRRAIDLQPAQRADYNRLVSQGVKSRVARAIAQAVTAPQPPGRRPCAFLATAPSATGIAHTLPVAEASSHAVMALSDGVVTTDEARTTIKEIDEAMAALANLRGVVLAASA
jgi:hypothetical protein